MSCFVSSCLSLLGIFVLGSAGLGNFQTSVSRGAAGEWPVGSSVLQATEIPNHRAIAPEKTRTAQELPDPLVQNLQNYAPLITVKVLVGDRWGSGVLIRRQGDQYLVLTNEHVLGYGDNYRVQTHDGHIFEATVPTDLSPPPNFEGVDLALVQFQSSQISYNIARLGQAETLRVGDEVFAVGFPHDQVGTDRDGRVFARGRVALLLNKPFEDGYEVGYTSQVRKGMSGGPVLNWVGEVVGVNGVHPYPLWEGDYRFDDGSFPCASLQPVMARSSWAIPLKTFARLAPSLYPAIARESAQEPTPTVLIPVEAWAKHVAPLTSTLSPLVVQMREDAETAQNCHVPQNVAQ